MRMMLALLLFALMPSARPGAAQEMPACNQDRVGGVACMAGKLCRCDYQRGGVLSGRPEGYRWDCGVLRPACGEALAPPALPGGQPLPMPQLFIQPPFEPPPGFAPPGFVPPGVAPPGFTPWPR
jgi:hypothetical protein